jgi:hypothetical protein
MHNIFDVAILHSEQVRSNLAVKGAVINLTHVPAEHARLDTLGALPSHVEDRRHLLH